jgi:hypothetical protein
MKTTIDIPDALFDQLKRRAAADHTTLRELVSAALRQFLGSASTPRKPFKLQDGSVRGRGLVPGVREGDWNDLADLTYEGRGGARDSAPRQVRRRA